MAILSTYVRVALDSYVQEQEKMYKGPKEMLHF
jgi:hypothetical protein